MARCLERFPEAADDICPFSVHPGELIVGPFDEALEVFEGRLPRRRHLAAMPVARAQPLLRPKRLWYGTTMFNGMRKTGPTPPPEPTSDE